MFEINTFTPHDTGALFGWLVVNRGPCSYVDFVSIRLPQKHVINDLHRVLIHPNTDNAYRDHTERATWIGTPWPVNAEMLKHHG